MYKRSVCTKDCPDTCGLLAKVENGRITKVKGDPDHPYTNGFICKKASYFPQHVHGEKRITRPLKRTGPKGGGQFNPISWDEALSEIAAHIQDISASHGPEAIMPYSYAGHMGLVQRNYALSLWHRMGATRLLYTICGPAATAGFQASLGKGPSTEIQFAADSDYIIIWGNNTLTTNLHAWPHFQKARKKGAKLVVIDPYATRTAQKADIHLMLKPGTDACLALAMMNLILEHGLADEEFIAKSTLGFDEFKRRAAEYPVERAAKACGLSADLIKQVALEYGRAKAPYIRSGWGPSRQLGGAMAMRTLSLLPALVGAFKHQGGGITRSLGGVPSDISCVTRPDLCPPGTRVVNMVELGNALTRLDDPPVKLLYVYMGNPAAVAPQSRRVMAGMAREDLFMVAQELYLTDTARFADIILPGASFFEMSDIYRAYGHNYLQIARPVIPPVGQSRPAVEIFQDLASRLGFNNQVFSRDVDWLIERIISDNKNELTGVDLDALRKGLPVRANLPANPYADGFNTPSGKVEFYSSAWQKKGLDPLPSGQVIRDPEGGEEYPLEFMTPPHRLFLNSAFNEVDELRRQAGTPSVMIHPDDAAKRGIGRDDQVRIYNRRGESVLQAKVTPRTRPGLLVAEGIHWPRYCPAGKGANQLTSQRLGDAGESCAFHCSMVQAEPA
jgi:anaerobic selenocysteine-containing dehydrogenase